DRPAGSARIADEQRRPGRPAEGAGGTGEQTAGHSAGAARRHESASRLARRGDGPAAAGPDGGGPDEPESAVTGQQVSDRELPIANCQLPITTCRSRKEESRKAAGF